MARCILPSRLEISNILKCYFLSLRTIAPQSSLDIQWVIQPDLATELGFMHGEWKHPVPGIVSNAWCTLTIIS